MIARKYFCNSHDGATLEQYSYGERAVLIATGPEVPGDAQQRVVLYLSPAQRRDLAARLLAGLPPATEEWIDV